MRKNTFPSSRIPEYTNTKDINNQHIKICLLGDKKTGKSVSWRTFQKCLSSQREKSTRNNPQPPKNTQYEVYNQNKIEVTDKRFRVFKIKKSNEIKKDTLKINVSCYDVAGAKASSPSTPMVTASLDKANEQLTLNAITGADIIMLFIDSQKQIKNNNDTLGLYGKNEWMEKIRNYFPEIPIYIILAKKDEMGPYQPVGTGGGGINHLHQIKRLDKIFIKEQKKRNKGKKIKGVVDCLEISEKKPRSVKAAYFKSIGTGLLYKRGEKIKMMGDEGGCCSCMC